MLELYDDRGLSVNRTESFLKEYKNIGIKCSGGTDSTFQLWWISKSINDLNLCESHILLPIHGFDRTWPFDTVEDIIKIIDIIRNLFPKVTILDPYIIKYRTKREVLDDQAWGIRTSKGWYFDPHQEKLENGLVDVIIGGATSSPVFEEIDLGYISHFKDYNIQSKHLHKGLLVEIDKKFVAYQYKRFNLMEILFPLTKSCILPNKNGDPCKQCDWCKEKYWAFGCYDGGVI
jgi:hypothetical protein